MICFSSNFLMSQFIYNRCGFILYLRQNRPTCNFHLSVLVTSPGATLLGLDSVLIFRESDEDHAYPWPLFIFTCPPLFHSLLLTPFQAKHLPLLFALLNLFRLVYFLLGILSELNIITRYDLTNAWWLL